MKLLRHSPGRLYLVPVIGLGGALGFAWASVQQWASNQPWVQKMPFLWIAGLFVAFFVGLVAEDVANTDSWVRKYWADLNRMFVIENVTTPLRSDGVRKWLTIVPTIRFKRNLKDAVIVVRVHEGINIEHIDRTFVLKIEPGDFVKDQSRIYCLAILPLSRSDGRPLGYTVWGDTHRESGDTSGRAFMNADNVVELEVKCGRRVQKEYIFLAGTHEESREFARVFIVNGHRSRLSILPPSQ